MRCRGTTLVFSLLLALASFCVYADECDNPTSSAQIVHCLGKDLRNSDAKINASYKALTEKLNEGDQANLRQTQRAWIRERDAVCQLDTRETNRERWYQTLLKDYLKTVCVTRYTRQRTTELETALANLAAHAGSTDGAKPVPATLNSANSNDAFTRKMDGLLPHRNGKWYFELAINYAEAIKIDPCVLIAGVWDKEHFSGVMDNIRPKDSNKDAMRYGFAVDLDNGKLYISRNGEWPHGEPGSNRGYDLKPGRAYFADIRSSGDSVSPYVERNAFVPNFGDSAMAYALPAGYQPWKIKLRAITPPEQGELRFGDPIKADSGSSTNKLLPLSTLQPPRGLADAAEVMLVSGYEPRTAATGSTVDVNIDRPGAKVLLILTCYEKVNWRITASLSTTISGIIVSGYYPPTVTTAVPTQAYLAKLPYTYETENINFRTILTQLNTLFGLDRVNVFRGSYTIPSTVSISAVDPDRAELTLNGPLSRPPNSNFTFELLATDYSTVRWTLVGPTDKDTMARVGEGKIAVPSTGKVAYRLNRDQLEIVDYVNGQSTVAPLPPNFPRFSWAMDIAYDTKRNVVTIVSLGGEGFLYRFDATQQRWIDFRSLHDIDIFSLTYDRTDDRYVAWTSQGSLLFISGEGSAMFTRKVQSRLEGFGRLYDRGNAQVPRLQLAAKGDDVALISVAGGMVARIWYYNVKTDNAVLTYSRN